MYASHFQPAKQTTYRGSQPSCQGLLWPTGLNCSWFTPPLLQQQPHGSHTCLQPGCAAVSACLSSSLPWPHKILPEVCHPHWLLQRVCLLQSSSAWGPQIAAEVTCPGDSNKTVSSQSLEKFNIVLSIYKLLSTPDFRFPLSLSFLIFCLTFCGSFFSR